jgi:hypothetical protein
MMRTRLLLPTALAALALASCRRPSFSAPDAAVEHLTRCLQAADGEALWRYLPPSMKADLAGLMTRFGQAAEPELSAALQALVAEAARALTGQAGRLDQIPPLREKVPSQELRQLFSSSLIEALETARSTRLLGGAAKPQAALERVGPTLVKALLASLQMSRSPLVMPWRPGRHRLQFLPDGRTLAAPVDGEGGTGETLVLVEGRWLPERWLTAWHALMARADSWLSGGKASTLVGHRTQVLRLVNQTRARLRPLAGAADQTRFDSVLSSAAGTLSLAITWAVTREPAP